MLGERVRSVDRSPASRAERSGTVHVRVLDAADVRPYRELMLEAYASAADAFTSTAEERAAEPDAWWLARIGRPDGAHAVFGAEVEGALVGTVAVECATKPKTKHNALLIGMYVRPHARGGGVGRALLEAVLAHAAARADVRVVSLTVTEGNRSAVRLYEDADFVAWGTQPLAIATPSGFKGKVHMSLVLADRRRPT